MAVIRVNKTKDYTIMSNSHFREREMSLKAKGLLSLMLSLPDDWDYSVAGLVAICVEKESAINATLGELKKFGYLRVDKLMPNQTMSGRIEYVYNIFESPEQAVEKQGAEKQALENQGVEFQALENQGQLNTKQLNTKKSITKEIKKESKATFDDLINSFTDNEEERELLKEWLKVRKAKRAAMTNYAIELNLQKLRDLANKSNMSVAEYLKEVICRGWQAFYEIKNYNSQSAKPAKQQKNKYELDPEYEAKLKEICGG